METQIDICPVDVKLVGEDLDCESENFDSDNEGMLWILELYIKQTYHFSGVDKELSVPKVVQLSSSSGLSPYLRSIQNGKNTTLDPVQWKECERQEVDQLPYDIDGHVVFQIKTQSENMMKVSRDGRPWGKWFNSSRVDLEGKRRVAKCKGSFKCSNDKCGYLISYGNCNQIQFQTSKHVTTCFT